MDEGTQEIVKSEDDKLSCQENIDLLNFQDNSNPETLLVENNPICIDQFENDTENDICSTEEVPKIDFCGDNELNQSAEIVSFADHSVELIAKEAVEVHQIETDVEHEVNKPCIDAEEGFEYLKKEEIENVENKKEIELKNSEGEEVKKELEDLVFQEELRLESAIGENFESENLNQEEIKESDDVVDPVEDLINEQSENLINVEVNEVIDSFQSDIEDTNYTSKSEDKTAEEDELPKCLPTVEDDAPSIEDQQTVGQIEDSCDQHIDPLFELIPSINNNRYFVEKCNDIFTWVHPFSSAMVFSILMLIELGLIVDYSLISLIAYSGLFLIVASFVYKIAVHFHLVNSELSTNCISSFDKEDVKYLMNYTLVTVDYLHKEIKSIAYVDSYLKNAKVFVILWILTYVGQMFNLQSLIFIGSLFLFSLPLVYVKFKNEFDPLIDRTQGQVNGAVDKIKSKSQKIFGF